MAGIEVAVNPDVLRWAIIESEHPQVEIQMRFPKVSEWIEESSKPTFSKLEQLANYLNIPFGYFFLSQPPSEPIIIRDFRTIRNDPIHGISKNLRDTIMHMEQIREWMRDYRIQNSEGELPFVGSAQSNISISSLTLLLIRTLSLKPDWALSCNSFDAAFKMIREALERIGVLVFISGIVGSNTRRKLDKHEFRAFALPDRIAPIIFINGQDESKAGRLFSLLHEFAHILIGNIDLVNDGPLETTCNKVAINVLAPSQLLVARAKQLPRTFESVHLIASEFKTSALAMAIHMVDLKLISKSVKEEVEIATQSVIESIAQKTRDGGGNFWNTFEHRYSKPFRYALAVQTQSGNTPYSEAISLLKIKSLATFDTAMTRLGV